MSSLDMMGRRSFVGLVVASALLPAMAVEASAGGFAERVAARPDLPAMGPSFRTRVRWRSGEPAGTIVISKDARALYLVNGDATAWRFKISVGRQGFGWTGTVRLGAKAVWPEWRPTAEMRARQPDLPAFVPSGPYNPLGARALYLHDGGRDTLYRIHGTNDPDGVGFDGTSGCFRLTNTDVKFLFDRAQVGAKVIVR